MKNTNTIKEHHALVQKIIDQVRERAAKEYSRKASIRIKEGMNKR